MKIEDKQLAIKSETTKKLIRIFRKQYSFIRKCGLLRIMVICMVERIYSVKLFFQRRVEKNIGINFSRSNITKAISMVVFYKKKG